MRIRVARKMYNPVVEAGQGAYYGNLVNPISESMGDTPYRIVFAINPLKSGEIDKVLVSEEDVDKIKQLREIAIYPNGNVITRKIGKNSTTPLVYYLTKEYARYIEHNIDNPLDFRRENIIFLRKETPREGVGNWDMRFGGATRTLISLCIRENPKQNWYELVKKVAEMKNCPMDEVNKKLKEFQELGMLGYHNEKGVWEAWE